MRGDAHRDPQQHLPRVRVELVDHAHPGHLDALPGPGARWLPATQTEHVRAPLGGIHRDIRRCGVGHRGCEQAGVPAIDDADGVVQRARDEHRTGRSIYPQAGGVAADRNGSYNPPRRGIHYLERADPLHSAGTGRTCRERGDGNDEHEPALLVNRDLRSGRSQPQGIHHLSAIRVHDRDRPVRVGARDVDTPCLRILHQKSGRSGDGNGVQDSAGMRV